MERTLHAVHFGRVEPELGAVGGAEQQLLAHDVLDEVRHGRVRRLRDLFADANLRREGGDPLGHPRGGQVHDLGGGQHGVVVAVGVDVFTDRLHNLCRAALHFDLGAILETGHEGALGGLRRGLPVLRGELAGDFGVGLTQDDMEPELGLDDRADLPRLEREHGGFERLDHGTLREDAERAALILGAVGAVLLGHIGEVRDGQRLGNLLGELLSRVALRGRRNALTGHEQDVTGGEHVAVVVVLLEGRRIGRRGLFGQRFHELLGLDLRDLRPHGVGHRGGVNRGVCLGAADADELVVDPQISDRDSHVLTGGDLRVAHQLGQLRDGEFLRAGASDDIDVGRQRVLEPGTRREDEKGDEQYGTGLRAVHGREGKSHTTNGGASTLPFLGHN